MIGYHERHLAESRMDDDGGLMHYEQRAESTRRRAGFVLDRYWDAHNEWLRAKYAFQRASPYFPDRVALFGQGNS